MRPTKRVCAMPVSCRAAGCRTGHADAVFIEDTAIVFDEVAIITRPGAASRRAETAGVASALRH